MIDSSNCWQMMSDVIEESAREVIVLQLVKNLQKCSV